MLVLLSVATPETAAQAVPRGFALLRQDQALLAPAAGWALFDAPAHSLPAAGQVEVELLAGLDGRRYAVRRALDVADHWQVLDVESGWLAAAGPVDVPRWLRENLSVPDGMPLRRAFHDAVCFSLPVTIAWLLDEPGLRERKTASLLGGERYRGGLRWLDGVAESMRANVQAAEGEVRQLAGRDSLFDHFRQRFEDTRRRSLAAEEALSSLRLELGEAAAALERLRGFEAELGELRQDLQARRLTLAGLEAQAERWQHWQAVHERAVRAMHENQQDWQVYQDALEQIAKHAAALSGIEPLRQQLRGAAANALALRREQTLLQGQLAAIRQAETAAADLAERVHQQQQLEQQIGATQERAIRLELLNRAIQQTLQESKRVEVLLGEVDRQLEEVEQAAPQAARVKKLEAEMEEQQRLAREVNKQVDHLRFLETAARAISGHLDDLRKGSAVSERIAVKAGVAGNALAAGEERTMSSHLREAIDHQIEALEKQLRDWQAQSRDLAGAPMRQNQLRSTIHQLEQEIAAARQVELKLGAMPPLRQHRKYLAEDLELLKKLAEGQLKEQRECSDAPARLTALRQDLSGLKDPRSEREALLRTAARKDAAEAELRQLRKTLADAELREKSLQERLTALAAVQAELAAQEQRRDDALPGWCAYLAQQAIAELASDAQGELEAVDAKLEAQRRLQEQGEAHETALLAEMAPVGGAPLRVSLLQAQINAAEVQVRELSDGFQAIADDYADAERTRAELRARQTELATRVRAGKLLGSARATIHEAEAVVGERRRRALAEAASAHLRELLGNANAALAWNASDAPTLASGGAASAIDQLSPLMQAAVALALRLALAAEASDLGTVFASGLGPLLASEAMAARLQALPRPPQFLVTSAW
jgi:chromosome segregation ATPase